MSQPFDLGQRVEVQTNRHKDTWQPAVVVGVYPRDDKRISVQFTDSDVSIVLTSRVRAA